MDEVQRRTSSIAVGGLLLGFDDFAAAQAVSADANALVSAVHLGVHRAQIDVPAPPAHIVRVADGISGQRLLAADFANLCHDESRFLPM